ncbi:MAG TPA: DUF5808 domain-containing protein, partial [Ktedonobacterales bacterium]|nr:DUF5808 domain-containing protein [Ktedonobacterales bacterium]
FGVLALALVLAIGLALLWRFAPTSWWSTPWMALVPVALALFPDVPYLLAYRTTRRLAAASPAAAEAQPGPAAELVPRRYGDYVPWTWESLPLAMIALTAAYLAITYAAAPAIIPIHFDAAGNANGFATKTIGSYFALVWLQLFMELFLTVLCVLAVGAKAMPGRAELRFRRRMLRFLYFLKVLVIAFMGTLAVIIAQASLGAHRQIGNVIGLTGVFLLLTLGGIFTLAFTTGQGGARLGPAAETATDRLDDRYWKLGVIYANPKDPSIFVERRFGLGWTINVGNSRALAVFVGLLVVPILVALAIAMLTTAH